MKFGEAFYIPYASVDEIPLNEFKNLHKQYWRFIADWRLIRKPEICSSITKERLCRDRCFACLYATKRQKINSYMKSACNYCPLDKYCCTIEEYVSWDASTRYGVLFADLNRLSTLALQVANLNWTDRHNDKPYNGGE